MRGEKRERTGKKMLGVMRVRKKLPEAAVTAIARATGTRCDRSISRVTV